MIYGASLGPFVKKALIDKGFQTNVNKIIETLPLDPRISNMDAVVLGPKDMAGASGRILDDAVKGKHPSVEILFFYQKDKEAELIGGDVKKVKVDKVNLPSVQDGINKILEINAIGRDSRVIESGDNKTHGRTTDIVESPAVHIEPEQEVAASDEQTSAHVTPLEQRVMEMGRFADFNFFKQVLEKDQILADLMEENTQYAGLVKMLEVLDLEILHVFKDTTLTAEQRFEKVRGPVTQAEYLAS